VTESLKKSSVNLDISNPFSAKSGPNRTLLLIIFFRPGPSQQSRLGNHDLAQARRQTTEEDVEEDAIPSPLKRANPILRPRARFNCLRLHVLSHGPNPVFGFHFLEQYSGWLSFWFFPVLGYFGFSFPAAVFRFLFFLHFFEHFFNFEQFSSLNVFQL
jgi:hypothetical protein